MNEVITTSEQLPSTISELTKFALVGRDKLKAVKAEIHAIDKLQLAQEVKEQKLREGQEIAEVVTDAECKIGELIREIPKATKDNARKQISPHVDLIKPKSAVLKENGISQRQAEHFQMMGKASGIGSKGEGTCQREGRSSQSFGSARPDNARHVQSKETETGSQRSQSKARGISADKGRIQYGGFPRHSERCTRRLDDWQRLLQRNLKGNVQGLRTHTLS